MGKYKKNSFFPVFAFISLQTPIKVGVKKPFKLEHWRVSKTVKCLIIIAIIAVMLTSAVAFLPKSITDPNVISQDPEVANAQEPTNAPQASEEKSSIDSLIMGIQSVMRTVVPEKSGMIKSAQTINSTIWKQIATTAWKFYKPYVGVDANTGLPYAGGPSYRGFTDWDLGSYIQALIGAQEIGLINTDGTWGAYDRINKVLTFLENRSLNEYGYPFQFYDATTGGKYNKESNVSTNIADVADTGRLFVALNNLRKLDSSFATRINNIVLNGRSNYTALIPNIQADVNSNSIYGYYIYSGFASFWPQQLGHVPSAILNNILNSQSITTYGVSLPNATICNEPLLGSIFELDNGDKSKLMYLMKQVYLACEAYYNSTEQFMAPSEGSNGKVWIYEWVVGPNGQPWAITDSSGNYCELHPIVYSKVAFSFLALYETSYARNMVIWLEDTLPDPKNGYYDAADNYGQTYLYTLSNIANTLILEAARYALQKA